MAALATAILRGLTSPAHLEELLSRGPEIASLSYCDPLGRQLIHIAADSGDVSALRWVLSHGADPRSVTTRDGSTALHVAAFEGHREAVTYLLEEASVGVAGVNAAGETALDVALTVGQGDIVRILTRHLKPPQPPQQQQQRKQQRQQQEGVAAKTDDGNDVPTDNTKKPPPTGERVAEATQEPRRPGTAAAAVATAAMTSTNGPTASSSDGIRATGRTAPFDGRGVTTGGFFVSAAWSKAGVCSCFNVKHRHLLGKHGVVFDMGVCPSKVRTGKGRKQYLRKL